MTNPINKVRKIKNCVDKDKALGIKSPVIFKTSKIIRKHSLRFNLSGYSQGEGTIT